MSPSLIALLVGAACFAVHAVLTLVLLRLPGRLSPVARHGFSFAMTNALGVIAVAVWFGPAPYWPIAASSGCGAAIWLFAFSAVYKSVSLRILSQLAQIETHSLSFEVVTAKYVHPEFEARVALLQALMCADLTTEGYLLSTHGARMATRIRTVQRLFGIDRSGLYAPEFPSREEL